MFPLRVIGPSYNGTAKGLLFRVVLSDAQYHQMFCIFQSNGHVDSGPFSDIVVVLSWMSDKLFEFVQRGCRGRRQR